MIFYNNSESIKYDLIVKANSNPNDIIMKYAGHNRISINNGNLIVTTSVNTVTELKPYAYQLIDNDTVEVVCNYSLRKNKLRFEFPNGYNQNIDLIIDPTLIFQLIQVPFLIILVIPQLMTVKDIYIQVVQFLALITL